MFFMQMAWANMFFQLARELGRLQAAGDQQGVAIMSDLEVLFSAISSHSSYTPVAGE